MLFIIYFRAIKLKDWVVCRSRNVCTGSNAESVAQSAQMGVKKVKVKCSLEQVLKV